MFWKIVIIYNCLCVSTPRSLSLTPKWKTSSTIIRKHNSFFLTLVFNAPYYIQYSITPHFNSIAPSTQQSIQNKQSYEQWTLVLWCCSLNDGRCSAFLRQNSSISYRLKSGHEFTSAVNYEALKAFSRKVLSVRWWWGSGLWDVKDDVEMKDED